MNEWVLGASVKRSESNLLFSFLFTFCFVFLALGCRANYIQYIALSHYITLHDTILYCIVLYCILLYRNIFYYIVFYFITIYYVIVAFQSRSKTLKTTNAWKIPKCAHWKRIILQSFHAHVSRLKSYARLSPQHSTPSIPNPPKVMPFVASNCTHPFPR